MKEIRRILQAYESIDFRTEHAALASVVNVEESSYRRIGARMLVRDNGQWTGGISGGCLERDALQRAQMAIFRNEATRVVYDTMDDDDNQIGVGLGCNGRIEVLFTPLDPDDPDNEVHQLQRIVYADRPAIMLKVIEAPEDSGWIGRRQLVEDTAGPQPFAGLTTVQLYELIAETKHRRKPRVYDLTVADRPMKLLVEYLRPETRLIIVGDNYDVAAMLDVAATLGWKCFVVGKAKKMTKAMYEAAERVVDYADAATLPVDDYTAVLLMSHDYDKDKAMLPLFAEKQPRYLGMLGPWKRRMKMQTDLDLDLDLEQQVNLYAPTGLEIGAESPSEIALSIAAEIVAVFREKPGGYLRLKEGAIHERIKG